MRRSPGRVALAVVFASLALNAFAQVALVPLGRSGDPPALVVLQALIGASGTAAAVGSWKGSRWAPLAALAYGGITAGMIVALQPILGLGADARAGLLTGGLAVFLLSVCSAWFLRRRQRADRDASAASPTSVPSA